MKLTQATYEINGKEVRIVGYMKGACIGIKDVPSALPSNTVSIVKENIADEDDAYMAANEALLQIFGGRRYRPTVANVTNSEICDVARVIEQIVDFD